MRLTIYLDDGGRLDIDHFDAGSALELKAAIASERWLTLDMDGATVLVNRDHIVRIDFETAEA